MSHYPSTTITTPHPTASRCDEWGKVLESAPTFQLPNGGLRSRVATGDAFRGFSVHGVGVRYVADAHDVKWIGEFNARHRPASGRGKAGAGGMVNSPQAVDTTTLEDALTLLELVYFYKASTDPTEMEKVGFPVFESERVYGVPTARLERVTPTVLASLREYWYSKRKASNGPLIPSMSKGTLQLWGDTYPDPFAARDWECPVVVQEPDEEFAETGRVAAFSDRLSDAIACGELRDSMVAADARLTVYSLAVARSCAMGVGAQVSDSSSWDGTGHKAVQAVINF